MTMTTTTTEPAFIRLANSETDRTGWLAARAEHRITASEIHAIAVGGRASHQRILEDKLNGSTFKGNRHTARGHEREPFLLDFAQAFIDPTIQPNSWLLAWADDDRIAATPDGLGDGVGVEAKSHGADWKDDGIPADHYDQMQLGMLVTGFDRWLYIYEVMGEDGAPTLDDPIFEWVLRDDRRIARLLSEARKFLAWWDAGAPAVDDISPELDDALAAWADARDRKKHAEADEKAADAIIRRHIAATPGAEDDGLKLAGRAAQFVYAVTDKEVLDVEAWSAAEPDTAAAYAALQARVIDSAKAAGVLYHKTARSTRLNITATKEAA